MTTVTGLPPMVTALPGMAVDRTPTAAAVQARQAEAASGRTPGAATETLVQTAVTGLAGSDRSARLQERRLAAALASDPDEPAGPPPAFDTTPLEKLRYPPTPIEALTRRMREMHENAGEAEPSQGIESANRVEIPGALLASPGAPHETPADSAARPVETGGSRPGPGYGNETEAVGPQGASGSPEAPALNIRA